MNKPKYSDILPLWSWESMQALYRKTYIVHTKIGLANQQFSRNPGHPNCGDYDDNTPSEIKCLRGNKCAITNYGLLCLD